jgi:hypothetical protein
MAQVDRMPEHDPSLRAQVLRILHSSRAAWWFRLLARTATVHFASCIALVILATAIQMIRYGSDEAELANHELNPPFLLTVPIAVAAAFYYYRRLGDPEAALKARKEWRSEANAAGFMTGLGVLWICLVLVAVMTSGVNRLFFLPDWSSGVFQLLAWLFMVLPLVRWAYIARRDLELELLEKAQPAELRVAINLTRLSEGFRERAQALEGAMWEATVISEQVQRGIEVGQQQFNELQKQYLRVDRALVASIEDGMVLEVPGSPALCEVCWSEPAVVLARDLGEAGAFLGQRCEVTWFHGLRRTRLSWSARSL